MRFCGLTNLPIKPYILACNHISIIDPILLIGIPRNHIDKISGIRIITTSHFYDRWYVRALIRPIGAIRIDKIIWNYEYFFRDAITALNSGNPILIYPEGGRNKDGRRTIKPGVGFLASGAKYNVVPAKIIRVGPLKYELRIGKPMKVMGSDFQKSAGIVHKAILNL